MGRSCSYAVYLVGWPDVETNNEGPLSRKLESGGENHEGLLVAERGSVYVTSYIIKCEDRSHWR